MGLSQEFLQGTDSPDPEGLFVAVWQVRIEKQHVEAECLRTNRGGRPDTTASDDAEASSSQSRNGSRLVGVPIADSPSQATVQQVGAPSEGQGHAESRVGNLFRSVVRHVANRDAPFASGHAIDSVIPDARSDYHPAAFESIDGRPRQSEIVVDHHGLRVLDPAHEIRLTPRIEGNDLGVTAEHPALGVERFRDEVGDDDFRQRGHGQE